MRLPILASSSSLLTSSLLIRPPARPGGDRPKPVSLVHPTKTLPHVLPLMSRRRCLPPCQHISCNPSSRSSLVASSRSMRATSAARDSSKAALPMSIVIVIFICSPHRLLISAGEPPPTDARVAPRVSLFLAVVFVLILMSEELIGVGH